VQQRVPQLALTEQSLSLHGRTLKLVAPDDIDAVMDMYIQAGGHGHWAPSLILQHHQCACTHALSRTHGERINSFSSGHPAAWEKVSPISSDAQGRMIGIRIGAGRGRQESRLRSRFSAGPTW
jgi:hypothetical protein